MQPQLGHRIFFVNVGTVSPGSPLGMGTARVRGEARVLGRERGRGKGRGVEGLGTGTAGCRSIQEV